MQQMIFGLWSNLYYSFIDYLTLKVLQSPDCCLFFSLVHFLLDEIVGSTVHRCLDAVTMEPSVVELICERG